MKLDQRTVNQIAAGEVIERPGAVVKELLENAMDAGATAITVEIRDGGTTLIRVTDNGKGIPKEEIATAFLRHATSKIKTAEDLQSISSLGFRGEALASIAAVAQVEALTKTKDQLQGVRYVIEGGIEKKLEEIGCPQGSTFIVRNLFFHTPARKKFLKSNATETSYIIDLLENLALSHPEISFQLKNNQKVQFQTNGNGKQKEIIYTLYGKEVAAQLLEVNHTDCDYKIEGWIAKPIISKGNKGQMHCFVNGRYLTSTLLQKAILEAYQPYLMVHRYPFVVLHVSVPKEKIDVNVHPTKMEARFAEEQKLYAFVVDGIREQLENRNLVAQIPFFQEKNVVSVKRAEERMIEPFEVERRKEKQQQEKEAVPQTAYSEQWKEQQKDVIQESKEIKDVIQEPKEIKYEKVEQVRETNQAYQVESKFVEMKEQFRLVGQIFRTYWMLEYQNQLLFMDQHAAHEKIMYEQMKKHWEEGKGQQFSQMLYPPIIVTLNHKEEAALLDHQEYLQEIGFSIETFGGREYCIKAVPNELLGLDEKQVFLELLEIFTRQEGKPKEPFMILEKIASLSCKAAIKGNQTISFAEANALLEQLFQLENPYCCPHGRPVLIAMSQYELEKKFKRVQ